MSTWIIVYDQGTQILGVFSWWKSLGFGIVHY
jgi:hypothetical protein